MDESYGIEEAEVFMSLVVPAYNEEERLGIMLKEATDYLQHAYGDSTPTPQANGTRSKRKEPSRGSSNGHLSSGGTERRGWEVLVVSDGSTDKTIDTALQNAIDLDRNSAPGIRVIHLHENRGKGGAVTHGMRHVRGQYAIFADADGASKFEDLGKLVRASQKAEDAEGRAVAVGSRAHLVGSEAVVKVILILINPTLLTHNIAVFPSQPPYALLPSSPPPSHTSRYRSHTRHTMWLQALLSPVVTLHHPIHALGRLDIRCRDAHAGGVCGYTRGRSSDRMARSQGEQVERALG